MHKGLVCLRPSDDKLSEQQKTLMGRNVLLPLVPPPFSARSSSLSPAVHPLQRFFGTQATGNCRRSAYRTTVRKQARPAPTPRTPTLTKPTSKTMGPKERCGHVINAVKRQQVQTTGSAVYMHVYCVAHDSRILVESLGLARIFLSRKVSLVSQRLASLELSRLPGVAPASKRPWQRARACGGCSGQRF
jgi:hypothetical protein